MQKRPRYMRYTSHPDQVVWSDIQALWNQGWRALKKPRWKNPDGTVTVLLKKIEERK